KTSGVTNGPEASFDCGQDSADAPTAFAEDVITRRCCFGSSADCEVPSARVAALALAGDPEAIEWALWCPTVNNRIPEGVGGALGLCVNGKATDEREAAAEQLASQNRLAET